MYSDDEQWLFIWMAIIKRNKIQETKKSQILNPNLVHYALLFRIE
jgi:hypothetical protein